MSSLPTRTDISGTPSKSTLQAALSSVFDFLAQRFAVGTTGAGTATAAELQAARESLGVGAATARNRLINGNFAINQLSVSGTVTLAAGVYGHDGWKAGASGCTYTLSTSQGITTLTISAGSLQQTIEAANVPLGVNTCVLSWVGTAQGKIAAGSYAASGVTASVTGGATLTVEFNTGALSLVQFELGAAPTVYEHVLAPFELQRCQRYYETGEFSTVGAAATGMTASVQFKVTKYFSPPMGRSGNWFTASEAGSTTALASVNGFAFTNPSAGATAVGGVWTAVCRT